MLPEVVPPCFLFVYSVSVQEEVFTYILLPASMLIVLYCYARCLMLKAVFLRQMDAMHEQMEQGLPPKDAGANLEFIP